jgi:hypothetical protein
MSAYHGGGLGSILLKFMWDFMTLWYSSQRWLLSDGGSLAFDKNVILLHAVNIVTE